MNCAVTKAHRRHFDVPACRRGLCHCRANAIAMRTRMATRRMARSWDPCCRLRMTESLNAGDAYGDEGFSYRRSFIRAPAPGGRRF